MALNYQERDGILYAKEAGKSIRKGKKVIKENAFYLGRVIDKENNVFYNKERGVFTYNPITKSFNTADSYYLNILDDDKRKRKTPVKEKLILDFGDAYFVSELIKSIHYSEVIDSIGYSDKDTIYALLLFYILCDKANDHALSFYEGSVVSYLYPNASISSQRIADLLRKLGEEEYQRNFFSGHINWLKKYICHDPAILIDSTGLPNSIHFPLAGISNHNGVISRETRMTTVVQRDSGYPMMYRLAPGNAVDMSTLTRTIVVLKEYGVDSDMALLDAGYFTDENIDSLYEANIDFITRLPERNTILYKEIKDKCQSDLKKKENLIEFNGRYVYLKQCEIKLGKDSNTAYAYLGLDVDRGNYETHKLLEKDSKKMDLEELHDRLESVGEFVVVSSLPYKCKDILGSYYVRQLAEQYFDIGKGISKLVPLRVHSETSLKGHLMFSQMAASINVYIQNKMKKYYDNREDIFMSLRNQKCEVYKTKIVTREGVKKANEYYDKFKIKCPIYLDRKTNNLIPSYSITRPLTTHTDNHKEI